ncbi:PTH1 family peptidyl-tRNA hydrolase [Arcanobacterium wilhelmae]|uniref:Peptidyl-tRNA hydrolase n=1 Tax=Arcanobacterium wilhelmae TaxID=1803177 RepID=A0ABT9NBZ6_9ACTO|nr:aminoacyl-tRNA hydrolase [Arcanobacterium wilhelmae]MDP9801220.1 PTH1 family peptidyl-tRNA hydrolase [Arcanobacterium wilhelmae]WFN90569.1 aminoacyl-tRNA hydrolase [Arcanobacterium wilhelmae]
MFAVVGLGNPGVKYEGTRHNAGHMVIEALAKRAGATLSAHKQTQTLQATTRIGVGPGRDGEQVVFATLMSYMNTSGGPTSSLLKYYNIPPENLIVVHDELDIDFGTLRLKRGGGEGGHNGLKSITASLGSKQYIRMRFGIGRPPGRQDPADYVLSRFAASQRPELEILIEEAADAVTDVIENGLEKATMRLHTR